MIGVLVKNGATLVDKQVFDGDDQKSQMLIAQYQAKNPTLTIEIHKDTDPDWGTAFDAILVPVKPTSTQTAWLTAKAAGPQQALTFIAKYLGLE